MSDTRNFSIRDAVAADADALVAMREKLQAHMHARNPDLLTLEPGWPTAKKASYLERIDDPATRVLIASADDNAPIGMAIGSIQDAPGLVDTPLGKIDDVWVEPEFRRHGIASALIETLLDFFSQQNISTLKLDYVVGNREAEAFWTKLGFHQAIFITSAPRERVERAIKEG